MRRGPRFSPLCSPAGGVPWPSRRQPRRRRHDRGHHHHPGGRRRCRPWRHDLRPGRDLCRVRARHRARHHHPRFPGAVLDGTGLPPLRDPRPVAGRVPARRFHARGLTIRGYTRFGSQVSGVDNFRLTGTRYVDNPLYGLFPVRCSRGRVDHNYVAGSLDSGVYVGQCSDVLVDHNVAHDNTIGLEVGSPPGSWSRTTLHRQRDRRAGADLAAAPIKVTEDVLVRRNVLSGNNQPNTITEGNILGEPARRHRHCQRCRRRRAHRGQRRLRQPQRRHRRGELSRPRSLAIDPLLDPAPDGGQVRNNVTRGNGYDPDPRLAPLPGADVVWDLTGSPCFVVPRGTRTFPPSPAGVADDDAHALGPPGGPRCSTSPGCSGC